MRSMIGALLLSTSLTGCAVDQTAITPSPPQARCDDGRLNEFVGQKASAELGTQMLAASRARALRWAPPGSALTMDFRPDRLTVAYDDAMVVTSARCG